MSRCSSPGCSGNHHTSSSPKPGAPSPGRGSLSPKPGFSPGSTSSSKLHNCGSPGCTRRGTYENDPRYTQADTRPADPVPVAGPKTRPMPKGDFSKVIYEIQDPSWPLVLVLAKYEDVQKYSGLKLMLFTTAAWQKVNKSRIDPHFYPDQATAVARFEPSAAGIQLAVSLMPGLIPRTAIDVLSRHIRNA